MHTLLNSLFHFAMTVRSDDGISLRSGLVMYHMFRTHSPWSYQEIFQKQIFLVAAHIPIVARLEDWANTYSYDGGAAWPTNRCEGCFES